MKKLIDLFAEKVLLTTDSFTIEIDEKDGTKKYHFFIQSNVGNARYIYEEHSWNDSNFYSSLELKPELVSIISDGNIYIVDDFRLNVYHWVGLEKVTLPKNTYKLTDIVEMENNYIKSVVFTNFYNDLEEEEITDENGLSSCKKVARRLLLEKDMELKENDLEPMFTEQDIANSLCGFLNLEAEGIKRLEEDKDKWIHRKSYNKKVKELMENHSEVETYEIKIAEGIRTVESKTVTVEFELNGKIASAKIKPEVLIRVMQEKDYFSAYNFEIAKRGEELISMLDAATWRGDKDGKDVLTCKHITKITYGKKVLYVKEA